MLLLYFAIVLYGPNTQQHSAAKDVLQLYILRDLFHASDVSQSHTTP